MKTNIKMRVTPEQSKKVQEICFDKGILLGARKTIRHLNIPFLFIDNNITATDNESFYQRDKSEEIDADLFIRTNGTCEETFKDKADSYFKQADDYYKKVEDSITNLIIVELQNKLKKKNEILKKARIKRKNQREELHKLNLKLQNCISLGQHNKIVDELKKDINFRNETIKNTLQIGKDRLKEIEQLKESSKISCNMLHSQKDKIDRLELNYVLEQSNYKKEIEKLKAVIEYLESKVK